MSDEPVMAAEILELIVKRLLEAGVPSGVVATVFDLDAEIVATLRRELLVEEYGTADQTEYLTWLQWKTLERVQAIIERGTPAEVSKIATSVFGRKIAASGRQASEGQKEALEKMTATLAAMREGVARTTEPSRFVVTGATEDGE